MTSSNTNNSEGMIKIIEKELLEEIKYNYNEIEKAIEKIAVDMEKADEDLQKKVREIYDGVGKDGSMH
ncbi:hypothetical protein EHEL_020505 [Encephalitozoon hellem ATCC 50504]|nr:uncharacterized protein EHEL_020505 [Encephalitozoon hellem ATCC 50504]AHL28907.1 hypothetical protein EHEL_020505 [Encephalitozoon hellem ATCC 50504]